MTKQRHGLVFYNPSCTGFCIYYLSPGSTISDQIQLTTEMPFWKAAKIVRGLNCLLFERQSEDREVGEILNDYLVVNAAKEYALRRKAVPPQNSS